MYILVAITGYLSYGSNVQGNIVSMCMYSLFLLASSAVLTSNFIDPPAVASTIGRAAIVVLVMFSYPLQVHPCRASVDAVLKWRPIRRTALSTNDDLSSQTRPLAPTGTVVPKPAADEISDVRFAVLTSIIIIASYIVAMTVSSLEAVLAYVGSTGSTSISFILPGLFYYKISDPNSAHHQRWIKDTDYDSEYESDGEGGNPDETAPLAASLSSLRGSLRGSVRRSVRAGRKVWPKGLLRKLSLALSAYGIVVMVVCLGTNIFFTANRK